MISNWQSLAFLPDNLPFEEAGPLLCAGVTVFNSIRNMKVMPPALVGVHGIGLFN
jgi:D-arabinose 1-dehydrogenase-like Zn-dependent alcohol dehydrogenase